MARENQSVVMQHSTLLAELLREREEGRPSSFLTNLGELKTTLLAR